MKQRDVFEVAVRLLGLVSLLAGVLYTYSTIVAFLDPNHFPAWHYAIAAVFYIVSGEYFLRGAPHLVRYAYPERRED